MKTWEEFLEAKDSKAKKIKKAGKKNCVPCGCGDPNDDHSDEYKESKWVQKRHLQKK